MSSIRVSTIESIGDFTDLHLDPSTLDYLALAPSRCSGLGGPSLRTVEEDAPGQGGSLILPPLDGAWIITLAGDLVVLSTGLSSESGYREAIDTLLGSLEDELDALAVAPDDLVYGGGSLKVWKHGELDVTWDDLETVCSVTFSLIVDVFA
jgi:hypothetical protein